jgi:hypothetical protein
MVPSVDKDTHAPVCMICRFFRVVLSPRTSGTPLSSALKNSQITADGVRESERGEFSHGQGTGTTRTERYTERE